MNSNQVKTQSSWILADPNHQFNIELKREISLKKKALAQSFSNKTKKKVLYKYKHKSINGEINI